jgi:hypothetical protein
MPRHNQWHVALTGWRVILIPFAFVAAIFVALVGRLFGLKDSDDISPEDVAGYLRDFIDGRSGDWDWNDFTSIPITDPALEAIRQEAEMVQLPIDDAGKAKLQELLARVRMLGNA